MKVAIIPARGGSKRIPRKNSKLFFGKPMIAWSIETALQSNCFDRVIVSTDDQEISEIARMYGAEVPFIRPPELSGDFIPTVPVINHAINWLADNDYFPESVCCLYATAPFATIADIQKGLDAIQDPSCLFSFPITNFQFAIQRALKINSSGRLEMFNPEHALTRSQDLEEAYHDAGQFYWGRTDAWLAEIPIFGPNSLPIMLPGFRVQDIDTTEDWTRAEWIFKALQSAE